MNPCNSRQKISWKLAYFVVLVAIPALAWGDQKKTSAPPPPKPAPQVKAAPAKPATAPSRPAPGPKGANTGVANRPMTGNRPTAGVGNRPATGMGARTTTGMGGRTTTGMGGRTTTGMGARTTTGMGGRTTTGMGGRTTTGMGARTTTGMGGRTTTGMGGRTTTGMGHRTTQNVSLRGGGTAQISRRANGRVADIHTNGMTINQGVHGGRTIVAERNGRTIVNTGRRGGYVQRPYLNRDGRAYYQRTYVGDGRSYSRVYRGYDYRGVHYYGYVPVYYYHPRFYGWAYHPWAMPVYYSPAAWGWVGTPWFGFYGGFFTPYPVYATASLWLTDYLIAANLQAAYQAGLEAGQGQAPPPSRQYQAPALWRSGGQQPDPTESRSETGDRGRSASATRGRTGCGWPIPRPRRAATKCRTRSIRPSVFSWWRAISTSRRPRAARNAA